MQVSRHGAGQRIRAALTLWLLVAAPIGAVMAQPEPDDWNPQSKFEGKFDWIQMKSGEWVKGEILVMYDEDLEFDSDEFDDLMLSWIRGVATCDPAALDCPLKNFPPPPATPEEAGRRVEAFSNDLRQRLSAV